MNRSLEIKRFALDEITLQKLQFLLYIFLEHETQVYFLEIWNRSVLFGHFMHKPFIFLKSVWMALILLLCLDQKEIYLQNTSKDNTNEIICNNDNNGKEDRKLHIY